MAVPSLGWQVAKSTKPGWNMVSNSIKGIETTQSNPVIILNCSDGGSISDRKEHRKITDLEIHGPARKPRQNPVLPPHSQREVEELLYSVCHCLNQPGKLYWETFSRTLSYT